MWTDRRDHNHSPRTSSLSRFLSRLHIGHRDTGHRLKNKWSVAVGPKNHSTSDLGIPRISVGRQSIDGQAEHLSQDDIAVHRNARTSNDVVIGQLGSQVGSGNNCGIQHNLRDATVTTGSGNTGGRGGDVSSYNRVENNFYVINNSSSEKAIVPGGERAPPPRPAIFFGRDELIDQVTENLLSSTSERHVAIIGAGGMGKTSLAKVILNEPRLVKRFSYRLFCPFDNIASSQVTFSLFVERVADALGVTVKSHYDICKYIQCRPTILVLDNAETFLDTGISEDASRIKPAIEEFGAYPSVSILITTRSRELPPGLRWKKTHIPNLDPTSARETFKAIYTGDVPSFPTLDQLLSQVGHHALAVTLLAQAADVNEWTVDYLTQRWNTERTLLLSSGYGKQDSLSVSIQLSLSSPSVASLGTDAKQVLRVIAFFPQGVLRENTNIMFSSLSHTQRIIDCLIRHSLLIYKDNFVTMLVPIRLYIIDTFSNPDIESLQSAQVHYYSAISGSREQLEASIKSEDINIESLFAFYLRSLSGDDLTLALNKCRHFLYGLRDFKPRRTLLQTVLHSVDTLSSRQVTVEKMECFVALFNLVRCHRDFSRREELELLRWELDVAQSADEPDWIRQESLFIADTLCALGQYGAAEQMLQRARSVGNWEAANAFDKGMAASVESCIKFSADPGMTATCSTDLFMVAQKQFDIASDSEWASICQSRWVIATVTLAEDRSELVKISSSDIDDATRSVLTFMLHEFEQSKKLLNLTRAYFISANTTEDATLELLSMVAVEISLGGLQEARNVLEQAEDELRSSGAFSDSTRGWQFYFYYSGVVQLAEGCLYAASESFKLAKNSCEKDEEHKLRAMCSRALGEISYMQEDFQNARFSFEETRTTCKEAGVPPELLYRTYYRSLSFITRIPPATHEGWRMFLDGRFPAPSS